MDADGEFETKLNVPEVVIPSTAVGDQIHTIIVREESGEVFTGRPSREIKLALGGMLETIMMGLVATFFGVIFAFPFSFVAARNLMAPITSILSSIVGSLLLLLPALWGAAKLTGMFAEMLGGLSEAPIQIALVLLLLTLIFGYIGAWIGSAIFAWISTSISPAVGRIVTGLSLGALTAGFGYILGIGFARGIVSIPLASDVPLAIEQRYAWGWAILLGAVGMIYGYRQALEEFSIGSVIYSLARTFMNIVRSIEPIIWAIIATTWVGLGPLAGTIALTLHTIAAAGKPYSESI
ncbi:MAG: hypothetical protein GY803_18225, partial [Chloroflexi bacterium]|nr:hypothetical protein [Chloroflexota bacterium]